LHALLVSPGIASPQLSMEAFAMLMSTFENRAIAGISLIGLTALISMACDQSPTRPDAIAGASASGSSLALRLPESDHGGRGFSIDLTGAEEVPGPGDPDGVGTAVVTLNHGQTEVCFELTAANIDPATAAHIHAGPAGVAGPVVVALTPPTTGASSGCLTVDHELVKQILQMPSQYYVNVHNPAFPAGAIRGQLAN
jgi:hypothetical protein